METLQVYDNYEISGGRRLDRHGEIDPHGSVFESCEEQDAVVWTLFGHLDGQGVAAIGGFASRDEAEAVYEKIVGQPFAGPRQAGARLKLMHAAPQLLEGCQMVVDQWRDGDLGEAARACETAIEAATAPCPPWASADFDVAAILARKQQIASIWSIADVQEVRPDLTDREAWEVLKAADHYHDATIGINWDVLGSHAELLFGDAPESDDAEEA